MCLTACIFIGCCTTRSCPSERSSKICEVCYAKVQGLRKNVEQYRNSPINGVPVTAYKPMLFDKQGNELAFPEPEMPLPPIQLRERYTSLSQQGNQKAMTYAEYRDAQMRNQKNIAQGQLGQSAYGGPQAYGDIGGQGLGQGGGGGYQQGGYF